MIIIKFRGKYIYLDNFQLGFGAYIATIGVMWFIEWRRKRKGRKRVVTGKFLDNTLKVRGGGFFLRRFLRRKLKKQTIYEVVNPRLVRYIRELTNTVDSKEVLYIDLELLAYAVRTMSRFRPSEVPTRGVFTIINPIRTYVSFDFGSVAGVYMRLKHNTSLILGSVALGFILYSTPYRQYDSSIFNELPYNTDNIQYVLKQPEVVKVITCIDKSPPEYNFYNMDGELISDKEEADSTTGPIKGSGKSAVCVRHKNAKHKSRVGSLSKLKNKVTKKDYEESEEDAAYVRGNENKERIRIRIENGN